MNPAQERITRTLAARARKALKDDQTGSGSAPTSGSDDSSSGRATVALSPGLVSSKAKRPRAEGSVDFTGDRGKGTYDLPPWWLEKNFFEGAALRLPQAESLHLEGLDLSEKRAMLVQNVGGLTRILEMVVAYTDGNSSQEAELKNLWAKLAASEKKVLEEEKAQRLSKKESGRVSEEHRILLLEKKALEEKVEILTVEVTPVEDKSADTKYLKTRAELVACFQLAVDDAQASSKGSFENTVKQMQVLNPGVELNVSGMRVNYYVAGGKILVLDYLREFVAQSTEGPAQLSIIIEEEVEG
ncbi:unnamed protein product [Vicia faba]|uniref:Uncharacterized protein n=1 Tax=Vicia faba TaxID=3906 RepID=A0AAV1B7N0_VICFA|nr:unnamed protein product [Vicia faba]